MGSSLNKIQQTSACAGIDGVLLRLAKPSQPCHPDPYLRMAMNELPYVPAPAFLSRLVSGSNSVIFSLCMAGLPVYSHAHMSPFIRNSSAMADSAAGLIMRAKRRTCKRQREHEAKGQGAV